MTLLHNTHGAIIINATDFFIANLDELWVIGSKEIRVSQLAKIPTLFPDWWSEKV